MYNNNLNIVSKNNKKLKYDRHLPCIEIPVNKLQMFLDWWNSDIRFESTVPHSFNEGYLLLSGLNSSIDVNSSSIKHLIKDIASSFKSTYRNIETLLNGFIDSCNKLILYFHFLNDNKLYCELYDSLDSIISAITITLGDTKKEEPEIKLEPDGCTSFDGFSTHLAKVSITLLITSLWYIASASTNRKYIYTRTSPKYENKTSVKVKKYKEITHTVYDMNKICYVTVDKLSNRKHGWTYQNSFQVCGHYRHYKNGKTIFVHPYIKGKRKTFSFSKY